MLRDSEVRRVKDYFKKADASPFDGANRRAIGLLPESTGERTSNIPVADHANRQRFLVAIEANQHTCCVKVISRKLKSRGAILIFRGRVLGAVYGRLGVKDRLFNQNALPSIYNDLMDLDTEVSAYLIAEPLAVATASLFHGQFTKPDPKSSGFESFTAALDALNQSALPGCVMVNDKNNVALLSAYVFGGKTVGLYSGQKGWLPIGAQASLPEMSGNSLVRVSCAKLPASAIDAVIKLTSSLTGLADRNEQTVRKPVDPDLRMRDDELAQLKDIKKGTSPTRLVSNRNRDAIQERELFLGSDDSHVVNT
jgi:hypothetical protein